MDSPILKLLAQDEARAPRKHRKRSADGLNAFVYARYSAGKNQKDISVEGQLKDCRAFAEKNNYTIIEEYADRHISGKTDNRADFRRLMRDVESGLADVVIVWKFDRFFRNRQESALYRKHLDNCGVKLISVKEFIPDGSGGIIMSGMIETVAEWYSAQLSENVSRGMRDAALKCQVTGPLPLGYRRGEKKSITIDPAGAECVRRAFEMYNDGTGIKEICRIFNSEGLKTAAGREWSVNSFNRLLRNKKYIGIYQFGDLATTTGGIPRILSDELFFAVQKRMEANVTGRARGKAKTEYFLSGKIFCGKCGKPMCGESAKKSDRHYFYYACSTKKKRLEPRCTKKNVPKDVIEDAVMQATLAVLTDENIATIAEGVERSIAEESNNAAVLAGLQQDLREVNAQIKNISKAILAGIITETTKEMLTNAEADRAAIQTRIDKAKAMSSLTVTAESVAAWLDSFRHGDKNNIEFKRALFGALVNSVYVYDDGIKIIFNVDKAAAVTIPFAEIDAVSPNSDTVCSGSPKSKVAQLS